jgi:excinuclease UvrABC ATPase subunit
VSDAGRSSLAFGARYAKAQRRYFRSAAPYGTFLIKGPAAAVSLALMCSSSTQAG